jgi:phosphopantetheinyl transferase
MADPTGGTLVRMAADFPAVPATPAAERVLLLAGSSVEEVERQLQGSETDLLGRDDACAAPKGGPCRLAIVAPTVRQLTLARGIVAQGVPWRGRNDVWFTGAPLHSKHAPGQLAFLFPGLEQDFAPRVDDVAHHFGLVRPELGNTAVLGRHGLSVIAVGRILDAALRELGITPDLVAGHSVGEWNAMISAGIHPRDAFEQFAASFDTDAVRVPGLVFAALGCGAEQAAQVIDGLDDVVVSHDNCPHQSIICGEEAVVAATLDRLGAQGITGQVLPFRSGFHSPMLAPYLDRLLKGFAGLPVRPPTVPVWSATTVAPYPDDPAGVRDLAARHLLEPVRFGPLVRRLYEEGVRAFIQVGTGSLPGFVADALQGSAHLTMSSNIAKRSGLDQLRRVLAALWVEGWAPCFDRLPTCSSARPAKFHTAEHPVLAEFESVLQDVAAAARAIIDSWTATTARPVTRTDTTTTRQAARTHATTTRVLSLDTMPYLADHCLIRQPTDWPEAADRYPVVPMTTMLELIAEAARDLVPGRTVIGVRNFRALRFLAVAPPSTVTVDATLDGDGNVTVVINGFAQGTALLADGYPVPSDGSDRPLRAEGPCRVTAMALYEDRWMFHGPRFQGVVELGPIGDNGVRGVFAASSTPGALLDNAGQLLGFWIMERMPGNRVAYPTGIERVHWYGPRPRDGDQVSCVVRICSITDTEVVADLELQAGGRLWARIDRWISRRFCTDDVTWPILLFPEHSRIAQRQDGGWFLARDRWPDPGSRELIMRQYLSATERAEYSRRNPRAGRQWLLGRIALKDAVRQWLWDTGAGPMHPVEITVGNHASGRPWVAGPFAEAPEVSLAHTGSLAAALVGDPGRSPGVGIDIEQVTDRDERTVAAIFTDAERDLLDATCSSVAERPSWVTRFWTAKEAVAKAAGTGLGGRPQRFAVERVDGNRLLVTAGQGTPSRWVQTLLGVEPEPYAMAWTPQDDTDHAPGQLSAHAGGAPR